MSRNLKGISKSIANKKYSLKSKGITDKRLNEIIPKGYSKLSETEQQNILNNLNNLIPTNVSNKVKRGVNRVSKKELTSVLKEINSIRNQLNVKEFNMFLPSVKNSNMKYQQAIEMNELIYDFNGIEGDIKGTDITKIGKRQKRTQKEMVEQYKIKLKAFDLNSYSDMLKYYGFNDKEIKQMAKIYNNGGYKNKVMFLKIINDFIKGKDQYQSYDDMNDRGIARDNFKVYLDRYILGGVDEYGNKIE